MREFWASVDSFQAGCLCWSDAQLFTARDLANVAWAFAIATRSDAHLFTALARAAERHMGAFNGQDLANTAWAFVTAGRSDAQLFTELARVAVWRVVDFKLQELTSTAQGLTVA